VTTYDYDGQRIIVEGFSKMIVSRLSCDNGEKFPAAYSSHGIRLLVNCSNLVIEDIDVDLLHVPRKYARKPSTASPPLGQFITKGLRPE